MARVNPQEQKVPEVVRKLSPELFRWLQELVFVIYQLRERTGGGDDLIEDITSSETFETSLSAGESHEQNDTLEQIEDQIPIVYPRFFNAVPVSANYTAIDLDFVEGSDSAQIKLSESQGAQIITANGDGSTINVDGDGIELRYKGQRDSDINIRQEGTSIHWYLFETPTELYWRAS